MGSPPSPPCCSHVCGLICHYAGQGPPGLSEFHFFFVWMSGFQGSPFVPKLKRHIKRTYTKWLEVQFPPEEEEEEWGEGRGGGASTPDFWLLKHWHQSFYPATTKTTIKSTALSLIYLCEYTIFKTLFPQSDFPGNAARKVRRAPVRAERPISSGFHSGGNQPFGETSNVNFGGLRST